MDYPYTIRITNKKTLEIFERSCADYESAYASASLVALATISYDEFIVEIIFEGKAVCRFYE